MSQNLPQDRLSFLSPRIGQRSLRALLIIPFILQTIIAVGITGVVAMQKGRSAIQILAQQYGEELGRRIQRELQITLDTAYRINAENADALELGLLNFDDPDGLERYFWQQLQRYDSISYISAANDNGGLQGVGRTRGATDDGYEYRSYETIANDGTPFQPGTYHLYRADEQGIREPLALEQRLGYDASLRPWYTIVANQPEPAWSDIYLYFGENFLGIAASHPIYDSSGTFRGVFATDLELSQLNLFLADLSIAQSGTAFIVERNGSMVASSTNEDPFRLTNTETQAQERLLAVDSRVPLIAQSTRLLKEEFGALANVLPGGDEVTIAADNHFFLLKDAHQRYFGQVFPFRHQQRLDWLIVVLVPESDFIAEIQEMKRQAIWVCVGALVVAIGFGTVFLRWVTRPLKRLSEVSQAIANGDFSQRLYLHRRDEIGILSQSFNQMADQVQDSVNSLQEQVRERTLHLEAAKKEAEAANRAKSQFLANMSHELRTPLNGILGYAQVLQRDRHLDPKHQRGLRVIQDCGLHLLALINDVLDLSKIEAQKMELQTAPFAFQTLLNAIADLFRLRAEQKRIQFHYDPSPDLPTAVIGDEQKLRQVLINLLSNAIKFTRQGTVTFRVQTVSHSVSPTTGFSTAHSLPLSEPQTQDSLPPPPTCTVHFHIEDTGVGIAPDDQTAIFQPFRQVGEQRIQEGTGLGLSISYQLVTLMGGSLTLNSTVGQGSQFSVELTLPVLDAWQPQHHQGDRPSAQYIAGFDGPPRHILVIDDIAENRSFVTDLLTSIGFEVTEAANGQAGLEQLKRVRPDLILMDLIMPVMDGFTTARTIRHDSEWADIREIPIIAMSASTLHQGKPQSLAAGCDAFVLKPIDTEQLLHLLASLLNLTWQHHPAQPSQAPLSERTVPLAPPHPSSNATPEATMQPPPQTVLETLWQYSQIGDISGILNVLHQLDSPEMRPFVAELRQLASEFRVQTIQDLIRSLLTNESWADEPFTEQAADTQSVDV